MRTIAGYILQHHEDKHQIMENFNACSWPTHIVITPNLNDAKWFETVSKTANLSKAVSFKRSIWRCFAPLTRPAIYKLNPWPQFCPKTGMLSGWYGAWRGKGAFLFHPPFLPEDTASACLAQICNQRDRYIRTLNGKKFLARPKSIKDPTTWMILSQYMAMKVIPINYSSCSHSKSLFKGLQIMQTKD